MTDTVLVVDDESGLRDLYVTWLDGDYEVREAADGAAALETVDDDVDVVLLDRRMPKLSGDETLAQLRADGYDGWVVMVSAVQPSPEFADMAFDDYLPKPAAGSDLVEAVEAVLGREAYGESHHPYFRAEAKLAVLESVHDQFELDGVDGYERLRERRDAYAAELDDDVADLASLLVSEPAGRP